jgi:hypothetical protein
VRGSGLSDLAGSTMGYAVPLVLLVLVGLLNLHIPFYGDTAYFMIVAKAMDHGAVLYNDLWDPKPPGIFLFYLWGGRLFGFTEAGIHLFELCWMLLLAAVMIRMLKRYFATPWLASLAPLATIGISYLGAGAWEMTQAELLALLPITLCLWIGAVRYERARHELAAFFLWGLCAAWVAALKAPLLPIPFALFLIAIASAVFGEHRPIAAVMRLRVLPIVLGGVAGLTPMLAWLWVEGALVNYLWTTFVWPMEIMASTPYRGIINLYYSSRWFVGLYFPLAIYCLIAVWVFARRERDLLTGSLIAWLLVGVALILPVSHAWHAYKFIILIVPVGILALRGLDLICLHLNETPGHTRVSLAVLLVLIAPVFSTSVSSGAAKAAALANAVSYGKEDWASRFQARFNETYPIALDETRLLFEPDALDGPIYVFGEPELYLFADRQPAIAISGWRWDNPVLTESQMESLPKELKSARPSYLFVATSFAGAVFGHLPETADFIRSSYVVARTSPYGTWYRWAGPS